MDRNSEENKNLNKASYEAFLAARAKRISDLKSQMKHWGEKKNWTLEIGCGHGNWLTAYSAQYPDKFCVGLDLLMARVAKSNKKKEQQGLQNLIFLQADAGEFLEAMPKNVTVDELVILFPDPWPKKRHFKNRLIQSAFLDTMAKFMLPQSRLYFRTDYDPYFEWAAEIISAHKSWSMLPLDHWLFEHETYFQKRSDNKYQSLVAERI